MTDLSIIIVNYKSEDLTIKYVKDQLSKLNVSFHTIVVNNSSTLESDSKLSLELGLVLVEQDYDINGDYGSGVVISSRLNLGFAKGNNLGANFAISVFNDKYLLFSNNDIIILSSDVVQTLIMKLVDQPDIGLIGPDCLDVDGNSQSPRPYLSFFHKYISSYWLTVLVSKDRKANILKLNYPKLAKEGDHYKLSGSFFLARSSDFKECEMMDPNTFLYCEEEILTERMYKAGKRVFFSPAVKVIHEQSQTVGKFINAKKKMILDFESNSYYYREYKGVSSVLIAIGKYHHYLFFYLKTIFKR